MVRYYRANSDHTLYLLSPSPPTFEPAAAVEAENQGPTVVDKPLRVCALVRTFQPVFDANGAKNIFLRNYEALEMTIISGIGAYPLQSREGLLHGSSRLSKHRRSVLATLRTSRRVE